jgi:hypothetical protein
MSALHHFEAFRASRETPLSGVMAFSIEVAPVRVKKTRQNRKASAGMDSYRR